MDSSSPSPHKIPVVNMGDLALGNKEEAVSKAEWQRVAKELNDALSTIGFVYLSNHGITDAQISDYFNACTTFFKLDQQTKLKYKSEKSFDQGYVGLGEENLDATGKLVELRECYFTKNLDGVFPDSEVPELKPSATAFLTACRDLAHRLLTVLAFGLDLERDFFFATHRGMCTNSPPNFSVLRINHYLPLPSTVPDNMIRCATHTDYGSFTLLFQDSMGGLQVRSVDGKWVDVDPIPGTIVVNIGDFMQIWTANRLKANEHRVIVPKEEVRQRAPRYSAAYFIVPDSDVLVQPIDGSTDPPPITVREHILDMYNKTYKH